jgi:acyl carrier protein
VLDRVNPPLGDRIAALVRQILARRGIDRTVGRDDDLSEAGLTSLDMVNLMLAIEAEFSVKVPDRSMTPSNFRTMGRIEELLGALSPAG